MTFPFRRGQLLVCLAVLGVGGLAFGAAAQSRAPFPTKAVTLVVPFTAGSGSDTIARLVAPQLAAKWGQPVVVDNKPGASGSLGSQAVARAEPDGHTLLMAINTHTMTPAVQPSQPYDAVRDFSPVAKLAEANFVLAVTPGLAAGDVASLVVLAKGQPGKLNYATPGNGTPHHLAMELLKANQGIFVVHVPYRGIANATTDLISGQVDIMFGSVPSLRTQIQAGRLKALAVTGESRSDLLPNVRTFREQGYPAMDAVDAWYAVLAPARTPAELVQRLNRDFVEVMNRADVKADLAKQGLRVSTGTPAQIGALISSDATRWKAVVKRSGITAD
ncbi:MAG: tripartite tricarboxylate transporter substrate binding protein [Gammaproteobacteria bacterium]|nr:tripartite tricarboxylate transporter substrate binding protein [Gammaproteobacteria bacterium]